jgi:hypothetical protein
MTTTSDIILMISDLGLSWRHDSLNAAFQRSGTWTWSIRPGCASVRGSPDGRQYAALAALPGDPSDGPPGVPGIGEKTAAALLRRSGHLAGLLRALDEGDTAITGAQRSRLQAARDYLAVAPTVVDVPRRTRWRWPGWWSAGAWPARFPTSPRP